MEVEEVEVMADDVKIEREFDREVKEEKIEV